MSEHAKGISKAVQEHLDTDELHYRVGASGHICLEIPGKHSTYCVGIRAMEDIHSVEYSVVGYLRGVKADNEILKALLFANQRFPFVRFSFDESDGEVMADVSVIIGEAGLAYEQHFLALRTLLVVADTCFPIFGRLLWLPGKMTAEESFRIYKEGLEKAAQPAKKRTPKPAASGRPDAPPQGNPMLN